MQKKITEILQASPLIGSAILFGSLVKGKTTPMSDIDIGILTTEEISLIQLGSLIAALESATRRKIDLIVLNDLYRKRPAFAREIVSAGQILFCKDREKFLVFKRMTYLYFFDTQPLRKSVDERFRVRVESGRFGDRNYEG